MDIVSQQYTTQKDNSPEVQQQQKGHEHRGNQQLFKDSDLGFYKKLLETIPKLKGSQECELELLSSRKQPDFSDKRKLHVLSQSGELVGRIEKLIKLHQKMDKTNEEILAMNNIEQDICNELNETDQSYIIKQDDGHSRSKEQQEKIREPQSNNNNSQQSLFKIQASNNNSNEKTGDNNDRQSLVIKLVKIAQQDDKIAEEDEVDNLEAMENEIKNLVKGDDHLESDNDKESDANPSEENKQDIKTNEKAQNSPKLGFEDQRQTKIETSQALTDQEVANTIQQDNQSSIGQSPSRSQLYQEDRKTPEHEVEDNNIDDNAGTKIHDSDFLPTYALGKTRRIRQKNRYFSDFHCMNLAKGTRSRDDYDTSSNSNTVASARTSNRRSTTDSCRNVSQTTSAPAGADDESPQFEVKRCRRCRELTLHDQLTGGCQACAYKKIVEKHKGGQQPPRASSAKKTKSRGTPGRSNTSQSGSVKQQDKSQTGSVASLKRKATDQTGGPSKLVNNDNEASQPSPSDKSQLDECDDPSTSGTSGASSASKSDQRDGKPAIGSEELEEEPSRELVSPSSESKNDSGHVSTHDGHLNPELDVNNLLSWTPDQVAYFLLSRGFDNEAEQFKSQSIDGLSLLLMQRSDFTSGLKLKLGPALKIYDQVCKLTSRFEN